MSDGCQWCGEFLPQFSESETKLKRQDAKFCNDQCRTAHHNAIKAYRRTRDRIAALEIKLSKIEQSLAMSDSLKAANRKCPRCEKRTIKNREADYCGTCNLEIYLESLAS